MQYFLRVYETRQPGRVRLAASVVVRVQQGCTGLVQEDDSSSAASPLRSFTTI
jgi:hypothetical protein